MSTETQGMSEDRLNEIESHLRHWREVGELCREVRRLQQRERDLQTAANMWEENYKHLKSFVQDTCHIYAGDIV